MNKKLLITKLPILTALTALLYAAAHADTGHSFRAEPWRNAHSETPARYFTQQKRVNTSEIWDTLLVHPGLRNANDEPVAQLEGVLTTNLAAELSETRYLVSMAWETY